MRLLFLFLVILFILCYSDIFFFVLFNFLNIFKYSIKDIYSYFKYKKFNLFTGNGKIVLYSGSGSQVFGSGKTLSMIRDVIGIYKQYNNKMVWYEEKNKFIQQHIHIISNVELYEVPYIKFENINQFVDIDKYKFGPMDVTIYVLDESGAIFNSREFRDNISTEFLTRLLQSRKNKCCMYMTSQRLQFTDKILREICSTVVACGKYWRIIKNFDYNPLDLEYALNPEIIKPKRRRWWFATDKTFRTYNTFQLVEQLNKKYKATDFLSTSEILETYGSSSGSVENVTNLSRKYKKRQLQKHK